MKLNCLIFSRDPFITKDIPFVVEQLKKARGREDVQITVQKLGFYPSPITIRDSDGDIRPDWKWFEKEFIKSTPKEYNAVGFHFTKRDKALWGISSNINGSYHNNSDDVLDFWFCCDDKKARNYDFSEAARLMLHEIGGHGDSRWTGKHNSKVHVVDYKEHDIHNFPERYTDYTRWNLLKGIRDVLEAVKSYLYATLNR